MKALFVPIYWILNLIQIAAAIAGFHDWLGWNVVISIILALIIGWLPILGTIIGVMGAVEGWGWEYWQAILLFIWSLILAFSLGILEMVKEKFLQY